MRFVFHLLLAIALALGIGFGLSYAALTDARFFGITSIGPWQAWPDVGSPSPNPYTRAHLARVAGFPLGQAEGLQFLATADSAGNPLTRDCSYRLAGHTPLASFWTLAALDMDGVNIAAPGAAPALRSSAVQRDNEGNIVVNIGTRLAPLTWLELSGEGPFQLALTLYDTAAFSGFSSETPMPALIRGDCA